MATETVQNGAKSYQAYLVVAPLGPNTPDKVRNMLLAIADVNSSPRMVTLFVPNAPDMGGYSATIVGSTHKVNPLQFNDALEARIEYMRSHGINVKKGQMDPNEASAYSSPEELEGRVKTSAAKLLIETN